MSHLRNDGAGISSALTELVNAFKDEKYKFGGTYSEDVDRVFDSCDHVAYTCRMTSEDKSLGMVFMLRGNRAHFSTHMEATVNNMSSRHSSSAANITVWAKGLGYLRNGRVYD